MAEEEKGWAALIEGDSKRRSFSILNMKSHGDEMLYDGLGMKKINSFVTTPALLNADTFLLHKSKDKFNLIPMSSYAKGRRAEWSARDLLKDLGFLVHRIAGSKGADLVIGGFPVEVKFRKSVPRTLLAALYAIFQDESETYLAGPTELFFSEKPALFSFNFKIPEYVKREIPDGGLLAIRVANKGWIFVAERRIRERLLRFYKEGDLAGKVASPYHQEGGEDETTTVGSPAR